MGKGSDIVRDQNFFFPQETKKSRTEVFHKLLEILICALLFFQEHKKRKLRKAGKQTWMRVSFTLMFVTLSVQCQENYLYPPDCKYFDRMYISHCKYGFLTVLKKNIVFYPSAVFLIHVSELVAVWCVATKDELTKNYTKTPILNLGQGLRPMPEQPDVCPKLGQIHTGRAMRRACKLECFSFDVAGEQCERCCLPAVWTFPLTTTGPICWHYACASFVN